MASDRSDGGDADVPFSAPDQRAHARAVGSEALFEEGIESFLAEAPSYGDSLVRPFSRRRFSTF